MPTDGGGIEENLGPAHRRESSRLGVPLVPADEHADAAEAGVPGSESGVPWSEIEFFVEEGIVRDVHLPVDAQQGPVRIDDYGGIVVEAFGALFEERCDHHNPVLLGETLESPRARTWNGLCEVEIPVLFRLAEILRSDQLLSAKDVGSVLGGLRARLQAQPQILLGIGPAGMLQKTEGHRSGLWTWVHGGVLVQSPGKGAMSSIFRIARRGSRWCWGSGASQGPRVRKPLTGPSEGVK